MNTKKLRAEFRRIRQERTNWQLVQMSFWTALALALVLPMSLLDTLFNYFEYRLSRVPKREET